MKNLVRYLAFAFSIMVSCSVDNTEISNLENMSIPAVVSMASSRAREPNELGGEKDEYTIEVIGRSVGAVEDSELRSLLKRLDTKDVIALRLFFEPSDFMGEGRLLGQRPKAETLAFLDSLPKTPPWPMERATAIAWEDPGLRFDWKSASTR